MRIESCTEGRSQIAAHLINEYRRGLFPFWEDVLGVFFYTANVWQDLKWQCGGGYNIKCCSVPSGKNEETGERTYEDENEIKQ